MNIRIPKKKNELQLLQKVELNNETNIELKTVNRQIDCSKLVPNRDTGYNLIEVKIINNNELSNAFNKKRNQLKDNGKAIVERYGFYLLNDKVDNENKLDSLIEDFARNGIECIKTKENFLGDSSMGIYVSKHIDVLLEIINETIPMAQMFLVKIMFQKPYCVQNTTKDYELGEPDHNCDAQIMRTLPNAKDPILIQYTRTSTYIYEYNQQDEYIISRPRSIIPFALLKYERIKLLKPPKPIIPMRKQKKGPQVPQRDLVQIDTITKPLNTLKPKSILKKHGVPLQLSNIERPAPATTPTLSDTETLSMDKLKINNVPVNSNDNKATTNKLKLSDYRARLNLTKETSNTEIVKPKTRKGIRFADEQIPQTSAEVTQDFHQSEIISEPEAEKIKDEVESESEEVLVGVEINNVEINETKEKEEEEEEEESDLDEEGIDSEEEESESDEDDGDIFNIDAKLKKMRTSGEMLRYFIEEYSDITDRNNENMPKWLYLYQTSNLINVKFRGEKQLALKMPDLRKTGLKFMDAEKMKLNLKDSTNRMLLKYMETRGNIPVYTNQKVNVNVEPGSLNTQQNGNLNDNIKLERIDDVFDLITNEEFENRYLNYECNQQELNRRMKIINELKKRLK